MDLHIWKCPKKDLKKWFAGIFYLFFIWHGDQLAQIICFVDAQNIF